MKFLRELSGKRNFWRLIICLLICCVFVGFSTSAALGGPKGKGLALGHAHGNPHAHAELNPHGSVSGGGASFLTGGRVNPAGIKIGAGPIGTTSFNTGSFATPKGHVVSGAGNQMFVGTANSNIVVKIASPPADSSAINQLTNKGVNHPSGKGIVLAAGDIFAGAIENLSTLAEPLTVPDPIGAKGPNPVHGGAHAKKGGGNPGGGNGKGSWGSGNTGKGFGNLWTRNQGRGIGEGMAWRWRFGRPERPNPPEPPHSDGQINVEPAPLYTEAGQAAEEEEFEEGGCPALMNWLYNELELDGENQISIDDGFFSSTDIQPCDLSARLKDASAILSDPLGVAALAQVVNEFVAPEAPISDERMALIADALANHIDDDTHYAEASRWLDALVEYIGILNGEIGWPVINCVAFVLDKYGKSIEQSGGVNLIAYVQAHLAGLMPSHGKVPDSEFPASENPQSLQANEDIRPVDADVSTARASAMPIYVFGGLGVLGAAGAMLVTLVKSRKE
ncbi:MAG: hypothetical protein JSW23_10450 [Planctomycetota bacterium]|nr:MAG: hypothetical protein JSW23_10450 [Planctomycetota bacterium]